jgi:hypothetical protein
MLKNIDILIKLFTTLNLIFITFKMLKKYRYTYKTFYNFNNIKNIFTTFKMLKNIDILIKLFTTF